MKFVLNKEFPLSKPSANQMIKFASIATMIYAFYSIFLRRIFETDEIIVDFEADPACDCRNGRIKIDQVNGEYFIRSFDDKNSHTPKTLYTLNDTQYQDLKDTSCDLYKVLRRGPKQKVIGYSLYGRDSKYYKELKTIVKMSHYIYPGWILRFYYDDTINNSVICQLECLKNSKNVYYDNVDFCYVPKMPLGDANNEWDATYMLALAWRWLPIGDPFVDYFMSRDTDSWPTLREFASVSVWLKSNTLFHIMRGIL